MLICKFYQYILNYIWKIPYRRTIDKNLKDVVIQVQKKCKKEKKKLKLFKMNFIINIWKRSNFNSIMVWTRDFKSIVIDYMDESTTVPSKHYIIIWWYLVSISGKDMCVCSKSKRLSIYLAENQDNTKIHIRKGELYICSPTIFIHEYK